MDSKFRKNWIDIQNEKVEEQYYRLAVWVVSLFSILLVAYIVVLAIIGYKTIMP